jgi:hypothetical protein
VTRVVGVFVRFSCAASYGVCHTVVEKGKSFINAQGELKLYEHYSIWKMSLSHNDNLVRKNYWNARRLDPITKVDF